MNNEPVAWMELYYGEPNNLAWTNDELKDSGDVYKTIPLYTHPAKTLTDEEIMDESFKAGLAISKDTDVFLLEHDVEALVTFARAILIKAQEK